MGCRIAPLVQPERLGRGAAGRGIGRRWRALRDELARLGGAARRALAARHAAGWRGPLLIAGAAAAPLLLPPALLVWHVRFDRGGLPDLDAFIRFEPPTTGHVYDARGEVLLEVAREYRRVISYDQVPPVVRDAILAAEDKNFPSHAGVDYAALPRIAYKAAAHSLAIWWQEGGGAKLLFPQGGSTLTQQLVRGYFLRELTARESGDVLVHGGLGPRLLSVALGTPATNKLLRKLEEARLAHWIEREMRRRYGSRERAKREILARYASFVYLGNGRYGLAAASEYYFGKPLSSYTPEDADKAALLAAIIKRPRDYAPAPGAAGQPRSLQRRNRILALMARNGAIPESLARRAQAEPIRLAPRTPLRTSAPAAIAGALEELRRHGAGRFEVEDLFQGRIVVHTTVDQRIQAIVNEALENGLAAYEKRHPAARGVVQGSVVVLGNGRAEILAEAGGRRCYKGRDAHYSDYNRVTAALRQPGSTIKPLVYLAALTRGFDLETTVPDEPIEVPLGAGGPTKWIANYDNHFKGPMPMRQALAESRNAAAVWVAREAGVDQVIRIAQALGIHSRLAPYDSTALGASEVVLVELANAYRAMASGLLAQPHVVDHVTDAAGSRLYEAPRAAREIRYAGLEAAQLAMIQEGLRGVVRLPEGTAHALDGRGFPIPVMGKTGTTSDFRDALFVGSTHGDQGITVAVWVGFDDNRGLGERETGARAALPIFREIMIRIYTQGLAGPVPRFPRTIEDGIDTYLATRTLPPLEPGPPAAAILN